MRPRTLAEACTRATSHETLGRPINEFLDEFYGAKDVAERAAMLAVEPALFEDRRLNALVAGTAEFLFRRWTPCMPPSWIGKPERYLTTPWFPSAPDANGVREYLTFCSPPEFKSRNIMTDAQPFRRASQRGAAPAPRGLDELSSAPPPADA